MRKGRHTWQRLIVAFRKFAKAPKNREIGIKSCTTPKHRSVSNSKGSDLTLSPRHLRASHADVLRTCCHQSNRLLQMQTLYVTCSQPH
jgi:hypothetical protein